MYTEVELLGRKRVPNGRQLDTFADALASLEYYLEALRENRLNRENILEIARGSLESLGYWPLPDVQPAQEESIAEPDAQAEQALADELYRKVAAFIDPRTDHARTTQADKPPVPHAQRPAPLPCAPRDRPTRGGGTSA